MFLIISYSLNIFESKITPTIGIIKLKEKISKVNLLS